MYTVHVQATGLRFATGGADSLVKVWGMSAVMDAQREKGGQLLLATLSDHASTVNAVRFSNNGKHLASGAPPRGGLLAGACGEQTGPLACATVQCRAHVHCARRWVQRVHPSGFALMAAFLVTASERLHWHPPSGPAKHAAFARRRGRPHDLHL